MVKQVSMKISVEPHVLAVIAACEAACDLVEVLPQNDLIDELKNLMIIQHTIFCHLIDGRHYGSDNLDNFISYTKQIRDEAGRIRYET
jgi:hypothetical protein